MIKRLALLTACVLLNPAFAATTESISDDAMERAAEKLIKEASAVRADSPKTAISESPKTDDDLPVALAETPKSREGSSVIWRLLASIGVLAAAGVGLHFASRRFSRRKDVGGTQSRIEMMHQYHLGPRKSLALVRVAGETMLVGITDQNINMLKSITLIDDDMAAAMNQDFNNFLEEEFAVSDVNHIGRRNS